MDSLCIVEAVAAVRAHGHAVEALADDMPFWILDGGPILLTDVEVIALADQMELARLEAYDPARVGNEKIAEPGASRG